VVLDGLEVGESLLQLHARDSGGDLTGVLEVNTEVGAARQGSCRRDRRSKTRSVRRPVDRLSMDQLKQG